MDGKKGQVATNPNSTPSGGDDEIFNGIAKEFSRKFLLLTKSEYNSLISRTMEFRSLLKKACLLNFLLFNLRMDRLADVVKVYSFFDNYVIQLKQKTVSFYQKKMGEYDTISFDYLKIVVMLHLVNLLQKFRSPNQAERRDALHSV
mmetsp:Transcript_4439/g.7561  ORF Transcript_4439/g.7561 Transcript_4439/m.7561 type:complete len:146 (-) Transcript_4439:643-1080(-)